MGAELAGGAAAVEVFDALRAGWRDGGFAVQALFGQDFREAAVHFLVLRLQRDGSQPQRRPRQERPSAFIRRRRRFLFFVDPTVIVYVMVVP